MDGPEIGQLVYLIILGLMVAGWFFTQNRQKMSKTLQQMILWVFLFAGIIVLYGLKDDLKQQILPQAYVQTNETGQIILKRAKDQHFYATLEINGQNVVFVIDTGATDMVLNQPDAERVGIDPDKLVFIGTAQTANGRVNTARVKLDTVTFGDVTDERITAWVNDGDMGGSLLGMSYLSRFSKLEISGDKLLLTR